MCKCVCIWEKKSETKKLGLLKVQEEPTITCSAHWEHDKDLGLPRALCNMLDAVQNQVLQLDTTTANPPRVVTDVLLLVKLPHRCLTLAKKNVFDPKSSSIRIP